MATNRGRDSHLLFFASYGAYLTLKILNTSFFAARLQGLVVPANLICVALLVLGEALAGRRRPARDVLWAAAIAALLLSLAAASNDVMGLACAVLFAYFGRNVGFRRVARFTLRVESAVVSLVVLCALSGLIENYEYVSAMGRHRLALGFLWVLYPSGYLFNIIALSVCVSGKEIRWGKIAGLLVLACAAYSMTDSRMAFAASLAVLLLGALQKIRPSFLRDRRGWLRALSFSFVACCLLSVAVCEMYDGSVPWMGRLDALMAFRMRLGQSGRLRYGYSLFGQEVEFVGNGLRNDGTREPGAYSYIDNVYVKLLIHRGLAFLAFYVGVYTLAARRAIDSGEYPTACVLIMLAFWGMIDSLILSLDFNTFWFAAGALAFGGRGRNLEGKGPPGRGEEGLGKRREHIA